MRAATASLMAASAALLVANGVPTALYGAWQAELGLGDGAVTIVYATAALGVLGALLGLGGASDRLGRRPLVAAGLALALLGVLVLTAAAGLAALVAGRALVGVGVGLGTAAAAAGLVDVRGPAGVRLAAVTTIAAIAAGPLVGAALVALVPGSDPAGPLLVVGGLELLILLAVFAVPEPLAQRSTDPLRPHPPWAPPGWAPVAAIAVAAWASIGLFQSLGPALVREELGVRSEPLAIVVVGVFLGASVAAQLALASRAGSRAAVLGARVLAAGAMTLVASIALGSLALFVVASAVAGAGQGLAHLGAQRRTQDAAPSERRGAAAAAFLTVAYLGGSVPTVALGVAADEVSLRAAASAELILLAAGALLAALVLASYATDR